ncbi:MAG: DUF6382 domain-containing protein [Lachnospiraceae bacterium]
MFREAYERKLNGNYLILEEEHQTADKNEFEIRMLQENNIPGFLRCMVRYVDGKEQYAYDITSRQSLKRLYEEQDIGCSDMKSILLGLMKGFEAVSDYLLSEENIILLPEYIYADIETKQAFLCFYPLYHVDIHQSFQKFAEFLLQKTDHKDEKAVVLAYAFYKQIISGDYDLHRLFVKMPAQKMISYDMKGTGSEYKGIKNRTADFESVKQEQLSLRTFGYEASADGRKEYKVSTDTTTEHGTMMKEESQESNKTESGSNHCEASEDVQNSKTEKRTFLISASVLLLLTGFVLYLHIYEPASVMAVLPYETLTVLIAATGAVTLFLAILLFGRQQKIRRALDRKQRRRVREIQKINGEREEASVEKCYCGETEDFLQEAEPVHRLVNFANEGITEFKLYKTPFIIGKKKAVADGVLTNPAISRMHAKIYFEQDNYFLMDLNSTNGTSKNGIRLNANESTILAYNDEVSFAGELFYFR